MAVNEKSRVPLAFLSVASAALTSLSVMAGAYTDPRFRWAAMLATAVFACFSAKSEPRHIYSTEADPNGVRRLVLSRVWLGWLAASVFFAVLLLGDIVRVLWMEPIEYDPIRVFQGNTVGVTAAPAETNPLFTHDVTNVGVVGEFDGRSELNERYPFFAETSYQIAEGNSVNIKGIRVTVVDFAPMPPFYDLGGAAGEGVEIEAFFSLATNKTNPTEDNPWIGRLEKLLVDGKKKEFRVFQGQPLFTIPIEGFTVRTLRYFVGAMQPGIYYVRLYVDVQNEVGASQPIQLTRQPIPLAFYVPDPDLDYFPTVSGTLLNADSKRDAIEKLSAKLKKLTSLRRKLDDDSLIPYPPNGMYSKRAAAEALNSMQQDATNLLEGLHPQAVIPVAPAAPTE